ncbi:protein kinase [Nocardiopsis sp. CT-R113]|uniref:Protein kinase n=1 Tax=Nocardiopsis codii TaxID=3065942 RepID=A0ABU7K5J6_9ACTN|nr:protein kinase [Nocardiopsis sp. CT-R113]MEE2037464.1 protein kinase [Nocardiopsis sp. CT-R113]
MTPPELNDLITHRVGPLVSVAPTRGGYSNATTVVVTSASGERVFVKAVPDRPGGRLDEALREAAVAPYTGGLSPALLWQERRAGWLVLGFEAITGRPTDFAPGSTDLPVLIEAVNRTNTLPVPEVASEWEETRWDRFTPEEDLPLMRGNALTHADLHPRNALISEEGRMWFVDWSWPTLASPVVTPSCLAVQLVASGHTPAEAEQWVSGVEAWKHHPEAARVFARADAGLQRSFAERWPDEAWVDAMAAAAEAWAKRLGAR